MTYSILHDLISKHFDLGEIRLLCNTLNVDYDDLSGDRKSSKIDSLITYMQRNGHVDNLIDVLRRKRPQVEWPIFSQPKDPSQGSTHVPAVGEGDVIRASVWNALDESLWSKKTFLGIHKRQTRLIEKFSYRLWADYFKKPVDSRPKEPDLIFKEIRMYFFNCSKDEFYKYVEFILNYWNRVHHYEPTLINRAVNKALSDAGTGLQYVPRYESPWLTRSFIGGAIIEAK
jgi:hypothetical protein